MYLKLNPAGLPNVFFRTLITAGIGSPWCWMDWANPHVAYTSYMFTYMNYGYRKNGTWTNWTISTGAATHIYSTKIALDENQIPHIAYFWEDSSTIYYQRMIKKTGANMVHRSCRRSPGRRELPFPRDGTGIPTSNIFSAKHDQYLVFY